ncbi:DNA ligase [Helicobacter monodelphidis]|uniref:DNA ligase n=1 Tax=Helicobacter sp. 15-1451 TaxID=2004995 RepID=UPI0015EC25F9|nr:DNA ligase [Helicobacter sp. 15-1451]
MLFLLCLTFLHAEEILLLSPYKKDRLQNAWHRFVMSEKFDGVRAIWDTRTLKTRNGYLITTPSWFTESLPPFPLDGELWLDYGNFEEISSLIQSANPQDYRWRKVQYHIFEIPHQKGYLSERMQVLQEYLTQNPHISFIHPIQQIPIESEERLNQFLESIVQKGGEGVVVREAFAPFSTGRNPLAMKLKNHLESECTLIGYEKSKQHNTHQIASLICKEGELEFKIGTGLKKSMRENPPPIGSLIEYRYFGKTKKGKPKFASFLRIKEFK